MVPMRVQCWRLKPSMKFSPRWLPGLLLFACHLLAWNSGALADDSGSPTNSDRAAIAREALSRLKGIDLDANPGVKAAVLKLLDQSRGTPQFVEIVRDFNIKDQD